MKKIIFLLIELLIVGMSWAQTPNSSLPKLPGNNINILVANDMGRRGISEQQNIANLIGQVADENTITFMAVPGDPIHDDGVKSVDDEEWQLKIENIYTAPSLSAFPWYVVPGNHEYRGNVQAILDYSQKSERWNAHARYYAPVYFIDNTNLECLFLFVDTTPMIDKYHNGEYSDAGQQDVNAQLEWIEQVLAASNARWKIVFGHHPVHAYTEKAESERADMQSRLMPLLEKYNATMYICGHIHNFQHIKPEGSTVEYIVNSSASKSREVQPIEGTVFCNPDPGFSVMSISADTIHYYMENQEGNVIYTYSISK